MSEFKGKVVIVTGASSGIGAATSVALAKQGASVVLVGRDEGRLKEVQGQCGTDGDHLTVVADVLQAEQLQSVVDQTIANYNRLDVLVNNAGAGKYGCVEEISLDDFDWLMNLNVRSVVQLTKLAIPYLKKTKGNIVNVSSVTGLNSYPNYVGYCMSKAAVDQFTKCTALDLAKYGVRVNSVNPAIVQTEFHKNMGMNEEQYLKWVETVSLGYPLKRIGQAQEVADAILFLANEKSAFLTGVLFPVSGGKHIDFNR